MTHFLLLLTVSFLALSPLILHELGHAAVMRFYRIPVVEYGLGFGRRILKHGRFGVRWMLLGAYVMPDPEAWKSANPWARFWSTLAGPAVNFGYAAALWDVPVPGHFGVGLHLLGHLSLAIGLFNLAPIPGLDGWGLVESGLEIAGVRLGAKWTRAATILGSAFVTALPLLICMKW